MRTRARTILSLLAIVAVSLACAGTTSSSAAPAPDASPSPTADDASPAMETEADGAGDASSDDAGPQEDTRPGVAVLRFDNGGSYGADREDLEALEVGLQQMLLTELDQNDELRIVERGRLRTLMEEQDLGASGRVESGTAARIGELVGARYVITGVFVDLDGDFRMDSRIVDVETGEILSTQSVRDDRERLYDLVVQLAGRVTEGADLPALPTATREAREAREIPAEAITLYSRAQVYQDRGRTDRAVEVYRRITREFPAMTEARAALEQLEG
jgi:curli biogenesis system outer membrane secretion channel CsgG